jgi:hypothetical protein
MNALQQFVSTTAADMGFLTKEKLATLISIDRLCPVLVRCGACRFTCGAQYVEHLTRCIEAGGDYVRDVSLPTTTDDYAAQWKPAPTAPEVALARGIGTVGLVLGIVTIVFIIYSALL